jgi:ABC-type nitrate/sulfonate/bicarbonate transport system substrate-binding protein
LGSAARFLQRLGAVCVLGAAIACAPAAQSRPAVAPATAVVAGGTAAAPGAVPSLAPLAQQAEVKIRTSFAPTLQFAPAYVAQDVYWPQLGIKGTTIPGNGSAAVVQAVGAGSDQMGMTSYDAVMNSVRESVPVQVLAIVQQRDPTGVIYTERSGVRDWKDLEGKTIGAFPFGMTGPTTRAAMGKKGLDLERMRFVTVNPGQEMGLLVNGQLDILLGTTHAQDIWLRCKGVQAGHLANWDAGQDTYGGTIIANTNWMKQVGDEVVTRALLGLIQGALLMKQDPASAFEIMSRLQPNAQTDRVQELAGVHPAGYVQWSYEGDPSLEQRGWGWIDPQRVERSRDAWLQSGVLQGSVELSNTYTTRFLEHPAVQAVSKQWASTPWGEVPADVRQTCGLDAG